MLLCEDISGGQPADRQCETGQYRFAVASGESRGSSSCQHFETHPTLPRIGTDRPRKLIVWLRPKPRCGSLCVLLGDVFLRTFLTTEAQRHKGRTE